MDNLRARLILLVCVPAVFLLVSCGRKPAKLVAEKESTEPPRQSDETSAGLAQQLQDVRYSQTRDGKLQWELTAKSVQQVDNGPTSMKDVTMTYYATDGRITKLTADFGMYNSANNNAALRGNVIVTTTEGSSVRTDALKWNQKEGILRGEGRVIITKGQSVIEGKGFELSPENESIKIYQVQGTIREGDIKR